MATFRTRTGRHGDKTIQVMVRRAGFPTLTETFPTRKLAEQWATKQEAGILEGKVSPEAAGRRKTLADAIIRYRAEVLPQKRNGSMYGFTLDWWEANHGTKKLGEVSRAWLAERRTELLVGKFTRATPGSKRSMFATQEARTIDQVRAIARAKGAVEFHVEPPSFQRSAATANRYLAALSHVFTMVCGDWDWLQGGSNPFAGLSKLKEGAGRTRHLTPEERSRLLQETAKDPQLHVLVMVALATAARAGELVGLRWDRVEFSGDGPGHPTECRLLFLDTKNGTDRIAWVFGEALELLRRHAALGGHIGTTAGRPLPVFPGQWSHKAQRYGVYDYNPRFKAAAERAGIANFRFHDLRHTAATGLAKQGASEQQLKAIGGWKSGVVSRYVHIAAQDVKATVQKYQGSK